MSSTTLVGIVHDEDRINDLQQTLVLVAPTKYQVLTSPKQLQEVLQQNILESALFAPGGKQFSEEENDTFAQLFFNCVMQGNFGCVLASHSNYTSSTMKFGLPEPFASIHPLHAGESTHFENNGFVARFVQEHGALQQNVEQVRCRIHLHCQAKQDSHVIAYWDDGCPMLVEKRIGTSLLLAANIVANSTQVFTNFWKDVPNGCRQLLVNCLKYVCKGGSVNKLAIKLYQQIDKMSNVKFEFQ